MAQFWRIVNDVIEKSDMLLLILDSRLVEETRNQEIEDKVKAEKKPLIYVLNKCDLVKKQAIEKCKLQPSVFVSSTKRFGMTLLRNKILSVATQIKIRSVKVGVLGYPNVGKSSVINALKGKSVARTSILSGHTRGIQKVKADNRILLFDTPGVIPYQEKDFLKHAFIGTKDFASVKDPDIVILELIDKFPGKIENHYGVKDKDKEVLLDKIAIKCNVLKKGGLPDSMRIARMILKDWQKGVII